MDLIDTIVVLIILTFQFALLSFAASLIINTFVYKSEKFKYWEKAAITSLAIALGSFLIVGVFVQMILNYKEGK
jgi:hypothetical protein